MEQPHDPATPSALVGVTADQALARLAELGTLTVRDEESLEEGLARYERTRKTLQRFVARHLVEGEYDTKGFLIPGREGDYYRLPGMEKRALTKRGAEKVADLFRYRRARTVTTKTVEERDYCSAIVRVELVDGYGRPVGSGESACSTAEGRFTSRKARKKYGAKVDERGTEVEAPDLRAALNEVVAQAGKRAFVQAVIFATATDEIFQTAAENGEKAGDEPASPDDRRRLETLVAGPAFTDRERAYVADRLPKLSRAGVTEALAWAASILAERQSPVEEDR